MAMRRRRTTRGQFIYFICSEDKKKITWLEAAGDGDSKWFGVC